MEFGHFILRKIFKFVATRCKFLRLNAPNSISPGAPSQIPLEELTALPDLLAGFQGSTSKGG